jgi:hypothetical protein
MTIIKARNIAKAVLEGRVSSFTRSELYREFQKLDNAGQYKLARIIWNAV